MGRTSGLLGVRVLVYALVNCPNYTVSFLKPLVVIHADATPYETAGDFDCQ